MPLAPSSPSWRWNAAVRAASFASGQAAFQLSKQDDIVKQLYAMKRSMDRNIYVDETSPLWVAFQLFDNRSYAADRMYLECLLLAGCEPDFIAKKFPSLTPADVKAFHDAFFEVLPYRLYPSWVVSHVLNGELMQPLSRRDTTAVYHRVAWMCGPDILDMFWKGRVDDDRKSDLIKHIHNYLYLQSALTAMTFGNRGEQDVEILRIAVDSMKELVSNNPAMNAAENVKSTVMAFLEQFPIGVADPTLPENLTLPAREPRVPALLGATP